MALKNLHFIPAGPRLLRRPAENGTESSRADVAPAVYAASVLSLAASLVHLWISVGYFQVWWGYGAFFLAAASAQGFLSVALLRWPSAAACLAGIFGNLAIVALYVVTRTAGIPAGPEAPRGPLDAGLLDMGTTAVELATVVFLLSMLGGRARAIAINAALLVGIGFWVLRLLGYLS
jgi:hypothetical protein